MARNIWSDVSSIAQSVQHDAYFIVRETNFLQGLVTEFGDMSGMNTRKSYKYNSGAAVVIGDGDDLTSSAFTPSADQTLTPYEIGEQFFVTDARAESDVPEMIMTDASRELGFAATDKVMTDQVGDFPSLTGGTVGAAGSTITWGYMAAGIQQARNVNKNGAKPLSAVIHGYQAGVLAKSASIAGATQLTSALGYTEAVTRQGTGMSAGTPVFMFMGVPIYQVFQDADASDDFNGAIFPKEALAIDWRRPIRVEGQRDASRRGWELNMSAIYDTGIWRPDLGISIIFDASAPTS
jgi:hypothetical protein